MARRVIVVKLPPEALRDMDRLLQRISAALKVPEASFRIDRRGMLRVEAKGSKAEIRGALARLKNVVSEFKVVEAGKTSVYTLERLTSMAGGPLSLEVLAGALKILGYSALAWKRSLETNAPRDLVASLADKIREAHEALSGPAYSRSLRRAAALAYALTGASIERIVAVAEERGLVARRGEKLVTRGPWKEAARELIKNLKAGESEYRQ